MRQPHLRYRVSAGVLALAGTFTPATAQGIAAPPGGSAGRPARHMLVLESYVGQRPPEADAVMAPLIDELEAHGVAADPASLIELAGGLGPRPGVLDPDRTAAEITQPAEAGYEAYTRGKFAEAEAALRLALEQIHRNPALLVLDTQNLDATFKILVLLALCQARRGDPNGSAATMVELIRTFRSQPIARTHYGPEAEQLYRAVWKQVQAMGRGRLSITVENAQAVIFVDGQIRGLGRATLRDLVPGIYRVFVQAPSTVGRQYEIEVGAGMHATLHVDWELDTAVWMSDEWVGLRFATEAERAKQPRFAVALARRWGGAELVAVVGLEQVDGRPGVRGTVFRAGDAAGAVVRSAVITLDGIDEPKLRALARFLAAGTPGEGVLVIRERTRRTRAVRVGRAPLSRLLIGAGAAAVIAGGALLAIDQDPGLDAPYLVRDTAPAGIAVGAAGVAAMSVGLWLWAAHRGGSSPMLAIGRAGGFIGWAGEL